MSMFEIRFSDILGMTLYVLIYLNFTVREGNQSDDDYMKLEDGEYMLCSSSLFMRQKTWHVLIINVFIKTYMYLSVKIQPSPF